MGNCKVNYNIEEKSEEKYTKLKFVGVQLAIEFNLNTSRRRVVIEDSHWPG